MADKRKKRILIIAVIIIVCLIIGLVILLLPNESSNTVLGVQVSTDAGKVHDITPNDKRVMENDRFVLELDEATLGITVTDKVSGAVYESVQNYTEGNATWTGLCNSGLTVEFYSGQSMVTTSASVVNELPKIEVEYLEDGFDADIFYEKQEFGMQLQVRLTEDGVNVLVPGASIKEGETFKAGAVWLYPMMGSTLLGEEEGYMVIPEGNGATINLHDNNGKYKKPYTKRIYGNNVGTDAAVINEYGVPVKTTPEQVTMPVFGMIYTEKESGFLGIVTDGDYNAQLTAYPNGVTTPYNWVTAKFLVRDVYTKQTARNSGNPTFEENGDIRDMGLSFIFVDGEEADYTGLAHKYQEYLVEKGALTKQEDEFKLKVDFLGADAKKWLIFNVTVPMTTVDDIENILDDMVASGAENLLPTYFGWQKDGITLNYGSTDLEIDSSLGSTKSLLDLMEKLDEQGIPMVLEQELLQANATKLYNTTQDIVKGINQKVVEVPTNQKLFGTMYYMTPVRSLELVETFNKEYEGTAVDAVSITGISNTLFSYYSNGKTYTRETTAEQHKVVMDTLNFEKIGMDSPNVYMWDDMSQYYNMSMSITNYNFIEEEIPFLPIVLRGYIPYWASYANFEPNETEFFLKVLEYGAYPTFLITQESPAELRNTNSSYIYTSEYSILKDKILDYEQEIGEVLSQVEGAGITEHTELVEDVVKVEYANGITLLINYSDKDYEYEGNTVSALSYYLVK